MATESGGVVTECQGRSAYLSAGQATQTHGSSPVSERGNKSTKVMIPTPNYQLNKNLLVFMEEYKTCMIYDMIFKYKLIFSAYSGDKNN